MVAVTDRLPGASGDVREKKRRGKKRKKKKKVLHFKNFSTIFTINYSKVLNKHPKNSFAII